MCRFYFCACVFVEEAATGQASRLPCLRKKNAKRAGKDESPMPTLIATERLNNQVIIDPLCSELPTCSYCKHVPVNFYFLVQQR